MRPPSAPERARGRQIFANFWTEWQSSRHCPNRLSDVFFVLGRWVAKHMGEKEYLWERGLESHRRPRRR